MNTITTIWLIIVHAGLITAAPGAVQTTAVRTAIRDVIPIVSLTVTLIAVRIVSLVVTLNAIPSVLHIAGHMHREPVIQRNILLTRILHATQDVSPFCNLSDQIKEAAFLNRPSGDRHKREKPVVEYL
ncbi:hypothetical protein [Sporomusa sp.]|uniref:hypothetical protein n=1 Tax=Sporomusa sp. TaxID=2078658 RepID=UPI002BB62C08|nr:hypothetical protein [Sporomusa sp.]HWR42932.1 hypothetical protein [Sporomusa sp.]